jgi:hypothetical protein
MPRTLERPLAQPRPVRRVTPSVVNPVTAEPFTLAQELKPFGAWVGSPIWVPPKDGREAFAATMLAETRPFASREARWNAVIKKHRDDFTQVREFDCFEASIRLPKGKFYVTVTEQKDFDKIAEPIPACVQTRLDEFLEGPGKRHRASVYYLKPLCVEVGDELILTTGDDLSAAITKVQDEVFAEYRRRAIRRRPIQAMTAAVNLGLAGPRALVNYAIQRRKRAIDAYEAQLEFKRRKLALSVAENFRKVRTSGCTFAESLALTSPLNRMDVVEQYCIEEDLTRAKREQLMRLTAGLAIGAVPWFVGMSITISFMSSVAVASAGPPIAMCDPAFVAEMPSRPGVLLKIGHFDEVAGVTHIEI